MIFRFVDLQMLQDSLVVSPSLKFYTYSNMLFHKYGGENGGFTNNMSHFFMFVPTKATVNLAIGNMGHAQVIGIFLCSFSNCTALYTLGPVYYFPDHRSNTISLVALEFYVGFQKVTSEPPEHYDFVFPTGKYWR